MSASKTKWVRLGDYIELCNERNDRGLYGPSDVMGMTITKEIIPTKAHVKDTELSNFLVVHPKEFVYNPRTHGKKIGLGYNQTNKPFLISWNNIAFKVKNTESLLPDYLYMLICRDEWDRNACFRSWGSSTEVFSWTEFGLMEIPLPSIEVQRELVDTYNGLKALAEQNEALVATLSKMCEAFVVEAYKKYPLAEVGDFIDVYHEKNSDCKITLEQGINIAKEFITPQRSNSDLSSRIIVRRGQIAYCTQLNNENVAIAYRDGEDCVVSPVYNAFNIKPDKENIMLPKYLFMCLRRKEFGRYVYWKSVGSAYEFLREENLREFKIPFAPIEAQQSIVNLYHCMEEAKSIAATAREKLKTICPALVLKGANSVAVS